MRTTMTRVGATVAATLLALAACGGDDDEDAADAGGGTTEGTSEEAPEASGEGSADRQAYVDAMVQTSGMAGGGEDQPSLEQAECIWGSFVDSVGLDELAAAASVEDVLADDEGSDLFRSLAGREGFVEDWVDGIDGCADLSEIGVLVAAGGDEFGPESIDCLRENIDADFARSLLVYGFSGLVTEEEPDVPPSFAAQMGEVEATCGSA